MTDKKNHIQIVNLANSPVRIGFDSKGLKKLIMLPDYSPGRGISTGTVAVFDGELHKPNLGYLGQDIGCGMLLARFEGTPKDLHAKIDELYSAIEGGDPAWRGIGRGNHFINIYEALSGGYQHPLALIHTGNAMNRLDSSDFGNWSLHDEMLASARDKRKNLLERLREHFGVDMAVVIDRPHNFIELDSGNVVYRKGCVKVADGEQTVIPSSFDNDALFVSVNGKMPELENSVCHGTGRLAPTGCSKDAADEYRPIEAVQRAMQEYFSNQVRLRPLAREKQYVERMERQIAADVAAMPEDEFAKALTAASEGARQYYSTLKGEQKVAGYGKADAGLADLGAYAAAVNTLSFLKERLTSRDFSKVKRKLNARDSEKVDPYALLEPTIRKMCIASRAAHRSSSGNC